MRAAVIDLGSNSIRLLVADLCGDSIRTVYKNIATTRLGRGIAQNQQLDEVSMVETLSVLTQFKDKAADLQCASITVFGTSALREARNRHAFLYRVKQIGLDVDILSGQEEAFLSFFGARAGLKLSGMTLVFDIGGGSTELILGQERIEKSESFPMGAVRWTQRYFKTDPPSPEDIIEAQVATSDFISGVSGYFNEVSKRAQITAVGVGGTLTTISAMIQELKVYDAQKIHGYRLSKANVDQIFLLLSLPIDEKRKLCGLSYHRADIITAGVLIAQTVMQRLGISEVVVSDTDIMEGYLLKEIF